ncbi:polysaccharide pyruvyl transferase family protein [Paenibacillus rhizoplanae]
MPGGILFAGGYLRASGRGATSESSISARKRCAARLSLNSQITKIIVFPQTIYFGDTELGRAEFKKTQDIYGSHKDLTLVAREATSYEIMKAGFRNNAVLLTPDIVMSLDITDPPKERHGALLCIRADKESIFSEQDKKVIQEYTSKHYSNTTFTDTCILRSVSLEDRDHELNTLWNQFKEAEVVITDRLHGMIFLRRLRPRLVLHWGITIIRS